MTRTTIEIAGMSCGHCVGAVKRALQSVDGITIEDVAVGRATVSYEPGATSPGTITQAIEDEGYTVTAIAG